jgi:3-dehydroquinate synthase
MELDGRYAVEAGLLDAGAHAQIIDLLQQLRLPVWHDQLRAPELLDGLAEFREHLGGDLCITLLSAIGTGIDARDVRPELVRRAIDWLDHRRGAA